LLCAVRVNWATSLIDELVAPILEEWNASQVGGAPSAPRWNTMGVTTMHRLPTSAGRLSCRSRLTPGGTLRSSSIGAPTDLIQLTDSYRPFPSTAGGDRRGFNERFAQPSRTHLARVPVHRRIMREHPVQTKRPNPEETSAPLTRRNAAIAKAWTDRGLLSCAACSILVASQRPCNCHL
jgi:hypothetical protein